MKEEKPRRNGGTSLRWTARAICQSLVPLFQRVLCEARNDAARRGELETILQTGETAEGQRCLRTFRFES